MASQMIWLLGYVSLGLALTLGNRPSGIHSQIESSRSRYDHHLKTPDRKVAGALSPAKQSPVNGDRELMYRYKEPYEIPSDWITYQDTRESSLPRRYHRQLIGSSPTDYDNNYLDEFTSVVLDAGLLDHPQSRAQRRPPVGTDSDDLPVANQIDLNSELIDRQHALAATSLKSPSAWSLGPIDYPWKIQPSDVRTSTGTTYTRTFGKRNQAGAGRRRPAGGPTQQQGQPPPLPGIPPEVGGMASQFMLRAARGNRQYDVPQIECPSSEDGMERFACPTPDRMGRYRCIDDHVLCDGFIDCPTGEDEDRQACMFYKTTKAHLDVLAEALLRWVRGR